MSGCAWTATSNAAWITVTAGATGSGTGSVSYSVATNSGARRIALALSRSLEKPLPSHKPRRPALIALTPGSQSLPASGGTGLVTVSTGTGCAWTSTSNAPWVTITSGASRTSTRDDRVFGRGQYYDRSQNSHPEHRRTRLPGDSAERIVHVRGHPFARCRSTDRWGHRDHHHDATVVRLDNVDHGVVGDGAGIGYPDHGPAPSRSPPIQEPPRDLPRFQRRRRSGHHHSEPANVADE